MIAIQNCSQRFCSKVSEQLSTLSGYAQRIPGASKVSQLFQMTQQLIFPKDPDITCRAIIAGGSTILFNGAIYLSQRTEYLPYGQALSAGAVGYLLGMAQTLAPKQAILEEALEIANNAVTITTQTRGELEETQGELEETQGELDEAQGELDEAQRIIGEAITLLKRDGIGSYCIKKGDIFLFRDNLEEALYCYKEGLKLDSENSDLLFRSAYTSALMGKKEEISGAVPTAVLRGWICADIAQNKKTDIDEAEIMERGNNYLKIRYYENLGFSFLREKKFDEALSAFNSALEIDKNFCIFSGMALAYQGLSQKKEALEYAEKVIENFQTFEDFLGEEAAARAFDVLAELTQDPGKAAAAREHAQCLRKGDHREKLIRPEERQEWLALFK